MPRSEPSHDVVVKANRTVAQVPADNLERLVLVGYVSLTGSVLDFLIRNQVETVFMTPTGRFRARLALNEHRHVQRRTAQYLKLNDPDFALKIARTVVAGKIENMARLLLLRGRQYGETRLRGIAAQMRALQTEVGRTTKIDKVRGFEGAAARVYFQAFPLLIRNPDFSFRGRNRRPPRDPVNALLSFVYTLLTNEVLSAVQAAGLDPYLGALHEVSYGRPSLACDLVEEYRACLGDRFVLGLINRRLISPDDFTFRTNSPKAYVNEEEMASRRPVEMKPRVCRTLITAYEEMMNRTFQDPPTGKQLSYRRLILNQARQWAEMVQTEDEVYQPFVGKPDVLPGLLRYQRK